MPSHSANYRTRAMSNPNGVVLGADGSIVSKLQGSDHFGFPEEDDLPPGWIAVVNIEQLIGFYEHKKKNLKVLLGLEPKQGCHAGWAHLSVSHKNSKAVPSHNNMKLCKELFLGNRESIAIWPPKDQYVNIAKNCLHLWAPTDPRDRTWPKMGKRLDDGRYSI